MSLVPEVQLNTDEQKASYGFGLQFGEQLRRNDFKGLDLEAVLAGIQHWYGQQEGRFDGRPDKPQLSGDSGPPEGQSGRAGGQACCFG